MAERVNSINSSKRTNIHVLKPSEPTQESNWDIDLFSSFLCMFKKCRLSQQAEMMQMISEIHSTVIKEFRF